MDQPVDGFLHAGKFYLPKDSHIVVGRGSGKTPLHMSLQGEMERYLLDEKDIQEDRKFIEQTLFQLLSPCRSVERMRDALPECLVNYVPEFSTMPRILPEAWSIQDNPRALRQYEKILPKIEVYAATALLY